MISSLILVLSTLLYPIDKPTHRMLIESSDLIVQARIIQTEINNDDYGCIATLDIREEIKSNHDHDKTIRVEYNCFDLCDWPTEFTLGKLALVYIKRRESGKYSVNGLSYGVSYPSSNNYKKIKQRINEYFEIEKNKDEVIDWIIKGLRDAIFINDTKNELKYYYKQLKYEKKDKYFLDLTSEINDSQRKEIRDSIPNNFKGIELSPELLSLVYDGDLKIKSVLVERIKFYRDSEYKHMARKYISILNSQSSTKEQQALENLLTYEEIKGRDEEETISIINKYLITVE